MGIGIAGISLDQAPDAGVIRRPQEVADEERAPGKENAQHLGQNQFGPGNAADDAVGNDRGEGLLLKGQLIVVEAWKMDAPAMADAAKIVRGQLYMEHG